jgi:hypothetical protein
MAKLTLEIGENTLAAWFGLIGYSPTPDHIALLDLDPEFKERMVQVLTGAMNHSVYDGDGRGEAVDILRESMEKHRVEECEPTPDPMQGSMDDEGEEDYDEEDDYDSDLDDEGDDHGPM